MILNIVVKIILIALPTAVLVAFGAIYKFYPLPPALGRGLVATLPLSARLNVEAKKQTPNFELQFTP